MNLRGVLSSLYGTLVGSLDVERKLFDALPGSPPRAISASVIAIGKAAPAMATATLEKWSPYLEKILVITCDGVPCRIHDRRLELLRAGHPLPDARSEGAAVRALEVARDTRGLVLVLVSGGASALVAAPSPGVPFEQKRELTAALLASGATIQEINTVRRHVSRIKGGGLTRAAAPKHVLAYVVSDVIGGGPHDVGSGPTTVDPTTADDARAILLRHARSFRRIPLRESLKSGDPEASLQKVRVALSPEDLALRMRELLMQEGFAVRILEPQSVDVQIMADEYRALAGALEPGEALVRAAEPLVRMGARDERAPGKGGRAGHLAALVAHGLPPGVALLSGASDGVDGASGTAGAVVDEVFAREVDEVRCMVALRDFDTALLHEAAGTALPFGPTGTNLTDIHVLARAR